MAAKGKAVSNPNGANQWLADPRQQLFLAYYKDPKSPTFSNARQSALKAGYSGEYADNILARMPEWLADFVGSSNPLLAKAEKNLKEFLELPNETQAVGMYGPVYEKKKEKIQNGFHKNGKPKYKTVTTKVPVMRLDPKVMKIKQDTSHFIAERIGKKKYGVKAGDGSPVFNIFMFKDEQRARIAKRIIDGGGSVSDTDGEGESS